MSGISRRTFMMGAATTAALAGTFSQRASAEDRVAAAVIGCRNRGHQVATSMLRSGQFDIRTMCDCDTAMLERGVGELKDFELGAGRETDFRRVLDDPGIDAVVIATPDHWHAQMVVMALDAGKHMYLEKPASFNITDGKAMVAAQADHPGQVLQVGTQQRSGTHFHDARDFVQQGGLGKVAFARTWITHTRGVLPIVPDSPPPATLNYDLWQGPAKELPYNDSRVHYNWRFMRDYGTGEMGNWGAHWLDVAAWFLNLGFPHTVSAHGGQFVVKDAKEWPDTQTVLYAYPELTLLWEQRLWTKGRINGRGGGVELAGDKGSMVIDRGGWEFHPSEGESVEHDASELDVSHARNFAEAIRGQAKAAAPISEGHRSAALCHLGNIATVVKRQLNVDVEKEEILDDQEAQALQSREYRVPWSLGKYA